MIGRRLAETTALALDYADDEYPSGETLDETRRRIPLG